MLLNSVTAVSYTHLDVYKRQAFFLGMTKYILDEELFDREHVLAHTALPFLIDAETGACLADVVTGTDPETGEPVELKRCV